MTKREREKFSRALDEYVETVEWPEDDDSKILVLYWHPRGSDADVRYVERTSMQGIFEVCVGKYNKTRADLDLVLKEPLDFEYPQVFQEMFDSVADMTVFLLSGVDVGTQFAVYPREDVGDLDWGMVK